MIDKRYLFRGFHPDEKGDTPQQAYDDLIRQITHDKDGCEFCKEKEKEFREPYTSLIFCFSEKAKGR